MDKPVIHVENLSKAYQIGQIGTGTISRDIERFVATKILGKEDPFLKIGETNDRSTKGVSNIVWSLKDINFKINQGDAVGIIGKNGAGKSTLLKILSRVTSPTIGEIKVKGRIASLLEVGTGFHPELSGRENIFLNGAILGMRKKEITRKLDEIIDFSGVERYIDTPVKRYSSGMYVRLAFAVAAHLESEILIVDEVLAVGDAEFQKKCLGKMGDISKSEGRTVLFVSHNISSIATLCNKAIFLEDGLIKAYDDVSKTVALYSNSMRISGKGDVKVDISTNRPDNTWVYGSIIYIKVMWDKNKFPNGCACDIALYTMEGVKIFALQSNKLMQNKLIPPDLDSIIFVVENNGFVDRDIRVDVGLKSDIDGKYLILVENITTISIPITLLPEYKVSDAIIVPKASIKLF